MCKGMEVSLVKGKEQYFQVLVKGMMAGLVLGALLVKVCKGTKTIGQDTVKAVETRKVAKVLSPKVHNMKVRYDQFTCEVLKEFCWKGRLKWSGSKKDLVERLQESDWAEGR